MKKTKKGRIILKIPRSRLEIIIEVVAVLGLVAHALLLLHYWAVLPEVIPTHFNFAGEADGWGNRNSLFFLLAVNIGLYLMITIFNFFPHIFNYVVEITAKNAREQYYNARLMMNFMKAEIAWLFAYIEWGTVQSALGNAAGLDQRIIVGFLIAIAISMLYFIWKSMSSG
jgi:uncharacterized membrane protein